LGSQFSGGVTKFSLAALRLYGYFCDFSFVFVSENKYDDDDEFDVRRQLNDPNWTQK